MCVSIYLTDISDIFRPRRIEIAAALDLTERQVKAGLVSKLINCSIKYQLLGGKGGLECHTKDLVKHPREM